MIKNAHKISIKTVQYRSELCAYYITTCSIEAQFVSLKDYKYKNLKFIYCALKIK